MELSILCKKYPPQLSPLPQPFEDIAAFSARWICEHIEDSPPTCTLAMSALEREHLAHGLLQGIFPILRPLLDDLLATPHYAVDNFCFGAI